MTIPMRKFGRHGPDLSILGFGDMRLPGFREGRYDEFMEQLKRTHDLLSQS